MINSTKQLNEIVRNFSKDNAVTSVSQLAAIIDLCSKAGIRFSVDVNYDAVFSSFKTNKFPSYIIGLPVAGMLNNLTWNNSALSGASATLKYRLVSDNPNVDLFYYPKYEINKKNVFSEEEMKKEI